MNLLGKIIVTAMIPEKLKKLKDIAYNLWWSWNSEAIDLYREIDLELWEKLGKNPVRFLQEVRQKKLEQKIYDANYMLRYEEVVKKYNLYMTNTDTWFAKKYPDKKDHVIAYFSAEYGLNEVLPIYSGGLGVLSGDHCKAASDLGVPFVAIGLFYKQGYFSQHINNEGWQETQYSNLNVSHLPLKPVLNENNQHIHISVELPGRIVYAKIWQVKVGRISIYLMDTDTEKNNDNDRALTYRLYGGDQETRIQQEIVLGIGGIRTLETLNIKPSVYHINEGHSSFLGLELLRNLIQESNMSFKAAKEAIAASIVFTTHTPVPAGNDVFPLYMMDKYFNKFWGLLGISRHEFLDLGLKMRDNQNFNMTVLALTLAGRKNGVSELHGAVTRNIFNNLWSGIPEDEVPISHITNGVHTLTWMSPKFKDVYDKYLDKDWNEKLYQKEKWNDIDKIPDNEMWEPHCQLKNKMIFFIRDRLRIQKLSNGEPIEKAGGLDAILDPNALTIGFARRFATYKRANLIFRDIERIKKILNNPDMPVQIIFAGKAHPADSPAHEVIKNIHDISRQEGFINKVVLVENYNMTLARNMVQGVDIWLNNPRRPLEASGTSGQKVCINGIINFSILDGWWCEGYNGSNGWIIGDETSFNNEYHQDNADSKSIYNTLEQHIIPAFYQRNSENIPVEWVKIMKESIKSLVYRYSTHRMVQQYTDKMYVPSIDRVNKILTSNYKYSTDLSVWKTDMEKNWSQVQIISDKTSSRFTTLKCLSGETITISTLVRLGNVHPSHVKVQIYYGSIGENGIIFDPVIENMNMTEQLEPDTFKYAVTINLPEGGEYGYTFRIIPYHNDLTCDFEMGLIRWAV